MRTTGIFTEHLHTIHYKKTNETFYLLPFGDVHWGSPGHSAHHWKDFLQWARKKPHTIFIGMGDYFDLASTSERLLLQDKKMHESTSKQLDNLYRGQVQKFAKDVSFMVGEEKMIGLIEGNHYTYFSDGTTSTQYLCQLLKCKYLGVSSFIRLAFILGTGQVSCDIFAHHGISAGRLAGATINSLERMAKIADADIYLAGHDHAKGAVPIEQLRLTGTTPATLRVRHRKRLLVRTGSFLRGYTNGEASYQADAAFPPTSIGVTKVELTIKRDYDDYGDFRYIDLHAGV